jgi:hypothetical protein
MISPDALIPALIALIGTLLTILVGVWQWRKQQQQARTASFNSDRQTAYKTLWEKVEAVHIKLRTSAGDEAAIRSLVQDVNGFILQNRLHLEAQDHQLANEYLKALQTYDQAIRTQSDPALKADWEDTRPMPPVTGILEVHQQVEKLRAALLARYQAVVRG